MAAGEVINNLAVLGGGLLPPEASGTGAWALRTLARVDRAGQYFQANRAAFGSQEAMILCAGGGSPIYDGIETIPEGSAEADLSADRLMQRWDVPASLIRKERWSTTSTMNWVESVERGLLAPSSYSADRPLGVVTHPHNYWRIQPDLRAVGFRPGSTVGIHPLERDPAVSDSLAKEVLNRLVRTAFFAGVRRGDLQALRRRNDRLVQTSEWAGGIVRKLAAGIQNKDDR